MLKRIGIFFIFLLTLAATCSEPAYKDIETTSREDMMNMRNMDLSNQFAYDILKSYNTESNKNIVLSPASLRLVLLMAASSSEGITKQEISRVLQIHPEDIPAAETVVSARIKGLNTIDSTHKSGFKNALFFDENKLSPKPSYLSMMEEKYRADIGPLDFSQNSAVKEVNDWVSTATDNRIPEVIDRIEPDELLFLINALYLQADWTTAFDTMMSFDGEFYDLNGKELITRFMQQQITTEALMNDSLIAVSVPLGGQDKRVRASFYMPLKGSFNDFVQEFNDDVAASYDSRMRSRYINLKLPTFETRFHKDVSSALQQLGIQNAFTTEANFSPITEEVDRLHISRVVHDTYLKMDEKGIDGAAVTTMGVGTTSMPELAVFDHPFILTVKDNFTGDLLFAGVIVNPSEE